MSLTTVEKNTVLRRIYRGLHDLDSRLVAPGEFWRPGGAHEVRTFVETMIDHAIENSARCTDVTIERICSRCEHRTPTGVCVFRDRCVPVIHIEPIMNTIDQTLREMPVALRSFDPSI